MTTNNCGSYHDVYVREACWPAVHLALPENKSAAGVPVPTLLGTIAAACALVCLMFFGISRYQKNARKAGVRSRTRKTGMAVSVGYSDTKVEAFIVHNAL